MGPKGPVRRGLQMRLQDFINYLMTSKEIYRLCRNGRRDMPIFDGTLMECCMKLWEIPIENRHLFMVTKL